ncbi:ferredoxin reductase family protein [Solimonas variicoloris]|uniref:ferredoxin reductase family protein n=1 Tax=Solimonas variicoloris TaxID=254408 RepID=UPI00037CAFA5|nr:ferric reductase-like transmembrane domain-containing protein [Solimonas variicoloris]
MDTRRLKLVYGAIVLGLTLVWWAGVPSDTWSQGFWAVRRGLLYYSGLMAIGLMSVAVVLAARPVQIERALGGLDKFYRLHKWLAITATLFGVCHWLIEITPRSMVRRGWIEAQVRTPRAAEVATGFDPFRDLHEAAAGVGEWSLYLLLALVAIALWKRFPYRRFFQAHRLLAALYLVLVFHSAILMGPTYWSQPIGPLLGVLMAAGSIAALLSLFRRIGKAHRAVGTIESLTHHADNGVLEVVLRLSTAWPGHRAGQFAFIDFGGAEGAHPFTIASAWQADGRLTFGIKALGDYTRALPGQLFVGQTVNVEGPYGRFDFHALQGRQIWVAGGIGITPFIAGLEALAAGGGKATVDLVYSTRAANAALLERLHRLADAGGARLHLLETPKDGVLDAERLATLIPDWKDANLWFCGPSGFGRSLRRALEARGLPAANFHQELFEMR